MDPADTDRASSPRLYGTQLHSYGRSPPAGAGREAAGHTSKNSREYGDPNPITPREIWILRAEPKTFTNGNIYVIGTSVQTTFTLTTLTTTPPISREDAPAHQAVPRGYQDQRALRGTHRGVRSFNSFQRKFDSWKSKQRSSRQDYRLWKSTLRTHGDQNPKPRVCPTSAAQYRLCSQDSQAKKFSKGSNQLRHSEKTATTPLPKGFDINIAAWNVEGLREVAQYDQILPS